MIALFSSDEPAAPLGVPQTEPGKPDIEPPTA
jgi:hypothetical protein